MRILRKWWISLPLATLVPVGIVVLQVYEGNVLGAVFIGLLTLAIIVQGALNANPEHKPLILLRRELQQEARSQRYHVLRQIGHSTYVFVEDSDDQQTITLWFFGGDILNYMEDSLTEEVMIHTRGVRIILDQPTVLYSDGLATLHYNHLAGTYSITPPDSHIHAWRSRDAPGDTAAQKRQLRKFWHLLRLTEARGRRHKFEK